MTLLNAEIVRYLRLGASAPDAALSAAISRLVASAPLQPRGVWRRLSQAEAAAFGEANGAIALCGTLGAAFDAWQRQLAVLSASDAFIAQAIGTAAIEQEMDDLEAEASATLAPGESLAPRWSPGYGTRPLAWSAALLAKLDATRRLGVSMTAAQLLVPSKSVTAVCAIRPAKGI